MAENSIKISKKIDRIIESALKVHATKKRPL